MIKILEISDIEVWTHGFDNTYGILKLHNIRFDQVINIRYDIQKQRHIVTYNEETSNDQTKDTTRHI